jgi:hypothetical protein
MARCSGWAFFFNAEYTQSKARRPAYRYTGLHDGRQGGAEASQIIDHLLRSTVTEK